MLDGLQEIYLVEGLKTTLRDHIYSGHRTALDPRKKESYDPRFAKDIMKNLVMPNATEIAEVELDPEENIEYMARFMRDMPKLLDETVTAHNMPDETD